MLSRTQTFPPSWSSCATFLHTVKVVPRNKNGTIIFVQPLRSLGALFLWLAETIKALLHEGDRTHHVTWDKQHHPESLALWVWWSLKRNWVRFNRFTAWVVRHSHTRTQTSHGQVKSSEIYSQAHLKPTNWWRMCSLVTKIKSPKRNTTDLYESSKSKGLKGLQCWWGPDSKDQCQDLGTHSISRPPWSCGSMRLK